MNSAILLRFDVNPGCKLRVVAKTQADYRQRHVEFVHVYHIILSLSNVLQQDLKVLDRHNIGWRQAAAIEVCHNVHAGGDMGEEPAVAVAEIIDADFSIFGGGKAILGTFRLSCKTGVWDEKTKKWKSAGKTVASDVSANDIRSIYVRFKPCTALREKLNDASFFDVTRTAYGKRWAEI